MGMCEAFFFIYQEFKIDQVPLWTPGTMVGAEGEKAGGKGTDDEVLRRLKERSVTPRRWNPALFPPPK